jgi:hypothetical protein
MESVREAPTPNHKQKPGELPDSNGSANTQSTPVSPPYWQHQRSVSHVSVESTARPPPISLEDHTEGHSDTSGALWARDITVEDYVIVRGGTTGIGAYVVWNCKVQTLNVGARLFEGQMPPLLTRVIQGRSDDDSEEV